MKRYVIFSVQDQGSPIANFNVSAFIFNDKAAAEATIQTWLKNPSYKNNTVSLAEVVTDWVPPKPQNHEKVEYS